MKETTMTCQDGSIFHTSGHELRAREWMENNLPAARCDVKVHPLRQVALVKGYCWKGILESHSLELPGHIYVQAPWASIPSPTQ